jgi:hypothetical protein
MDCKYTMVSAKVYCLHTKPLVAFWASMVKSTQEVAGDGE